ncbi:YgjP-like metallopeptidase domain-containing protein [Chryseobacterium salipaludis]
MKYLLDSVPNHNDEFRALLYRYMPNWREYQRELNALPVAGNEMMD